MSLKSLSSNIFSYRDVLDEPYGLYISTQRIIAGSQKPGKQKLKLMGEKPLSWLSSILAAVVAVVPAALIGIVIVAPVLMNYSEKVTAEYVFRDATAQLPKPKMVIIDYSDEPYTASSGLNLKPDDIVEDSKVDRPATYRLAPMPPAAIF